MFLHAHGSFGIAIARGMIDVCWPNWHVNADAVGGTDMLEANVSLSGQAVSDRGGDLSSSAPETQLRSEGLDLYTHVSVHACLFV